MASQNNWRIPESLEKVIPIPRSLHPHLQWWLEESNVLQGQPLHPIKHALQIFTDASKEGWGAHLNEHTARGTWPLPESKLSGTKSSLSSLKRVPVPLLRQGSTCSSRQHYSSVIHKQGRRHEVGSTVCSTVLHCGESQSPTHSRPAECGSRQAIQARPDHPYRVVSPSRGLPTICSRWYQPQIDLFALRFNKLPLFMSPVPDPLATAVDALRLPWEDLDTYAFPLAAILGKVVEKLQDSPCKRIILIAPRWPNIPWFWDLVAMSTQILLSLPNLLTQAFNQIPHRNLTSLNLHAWLLEPQQSRSRASLRQ